MYNSSVHHKLRRLWSAQLFSKLIFINCSSYFTVNFQANDLQLGQLEVLYCCAENTIFTKKRSVYFLLFALNYKEKYQLFSVLEFSLTKFN